MLEFGSSFLKRAIEELSLAYNPRVLPGSSLLILQSLKKARAATDFNQMIFVKRPFELAFGKR
jgi:hypothetical protein